MTLPDVVRKQAERANAAQQSLSGNPDKSAPNADEFEQQQQQQQEAEKPNTENEAKQDKPDNKEADPEYWKNRFMTLQGKYNKEVPALSNQLSQLRQQIEQLEKKPVAPTPYLTDEEREEYGDIGSMMERVARKAAEDATKPLVETHQKTQQQTYYEQLDGAAKNWRDINEDEGFNAWLDELDPMAGTTRRELLNSAFEAKDAKRTATFFNTWGEANKPATAKRTENMEQQPTMPNTAKGEQQVTTPPTFTSKQIKQFYDEKARGAYKGREAEAAAIERQIFESLQGS